MYDCVFLKEDPERGRKTCSIYPVRPLQCRTWPFWPENLAEIAPAGIVRPYDVTA